MCSLILGVIRPAASGICGHDFPITTDCTLEMRVKINLYRYYVIHNSEKNRNITHRRPSAPICSQEHEQPRWVRVAHEDSLMRVCKGNRCNILAPAAMVVVSACLPWRFCGFCKERSGRDELMYYIGKL